MHSFKNKNKNKNMHINDSLIYIHKFIVIVRIFLDICVQFDFIFKKYI